MIISKVKKYAIGACLGVLGMALSIVGYVAARDGIRLLKSDTDKYSITLDSSNAVTSGGDHEMHTRRGSAVEFTYTSVASSTGNHTRINQNGTIVNKDQITSISSITATFSGTGTLKARISYVNDTNKWGDYFILILDQE